MIASRMDVCFWSELLTGFTLRIDELEYFERNVIPSRQVGDPGFIEGFAVNFYSTLVLDHGSRDGSSYYERYADPVTSRSMDFS